MRTIKGGVADKLGIEYKPNINLMLLKRGYSLKQINPELDNYLNTMKKIREEKIDWGDDLSKKCMKKLG